MSLFIASLNSGSNGNCYYVGTKKEAVLVDAGISCREIEKRLTRLDLSIAHIKAVFISHEHSDHIKGVEVLSKKHNLPVYITEKTLHNSGLKLRADLCNTFDTIEAVNIGGLKISAFSKFHDAADPHSFTISYNNLTIGVFTDIGACCPNVIENFKICNAVFLETNYDSKMLHEGNYPYHLKKRISGGLGHLSNSQALELFQNHRTDKLKLLLLSHLSKENNNPSLAIELFQKEAMDTEIVLASRYEESQLYRIQSNEKIKTRKTASELSPQMSLF